MKQRERPNENELSDRWRKRAWHSGHFCLSLIGASSIRGIRLRA